MALAALRNVIQSWRNFVARIRACCQSVYNHRFALLALVILCIVCRFVPSVFSYVISCAPILICTAVLLNILLSLGRSTNEQANEQAEEKTVHDTSVNVRHTEKQKAFTSESRLKRRNNIRERALAKSGFGDIGKASSGKDKKVAFSSLPAIPLPRDHLARRTITLGEQAREISRRSKEKEDSDDAEDCSFASDRAECSSPESPPTDVLPVIDEYNPLLESKPPQIPTASPYDSDAVLESSDRSVDGSNDSETENQEETQENKEERGNKPFVTWTEDDEKNLMDLGTSELERNQRLESLIAKRRARRCVSSVIERNLIDFDSNDPPVQAPSIRPVKKNPFDAPYNSSENDGLPPVPGSAPSVLVPRGNPFDLPYDPQEEKPNLKEDSFQQEFTSVFCRHESFNYSPSSSFMGGLKHDRYNTKYTPYVGAEGMVSNRNENAGSSLQLREKRHSIFEQLPPIDRKNHKKQMERVLSLGVYPSYVAQERIIPDMRFFKPYNEVKSDANFNKAETKSLEEDKSDGFMGPEVVKEKYDKASFSSTPEIKEEVVHVEHSEIPEQASTSETKEEVSEQASTSESDDEIVEEKNEEFQSKNVEPASENDFDHQHGDSKEAPSSEDSDHNSQTTEGVDDVHIKEPVYDSSPTAVEKRTIDEYIIYPNKSQNLTHTASVDSDLQVEVSEAGSPRESLDRYTYADGESSSYDGNDKNAIVSGGNAVEEKEPRPIEATESGEYDAVIFETPRAEPYLEPTVVAEPEVPEVHQQGAVVDSTTPSPSTDLNKGEPLQEEMSNIPSFDSHHSEESQAASSKYAVEANDSDTNEALSEDATVEGFASISNPMEVAEARNGENEDSNSKSQISEGADSNGNVNDKIEISEVDEKNSMEATVDAGEIKAEAPGMDDKEHNGVNDNIEALVDISKPLESTMADSEANNDIKEVPTEESIPKDVTETSGEASEVPETKGNDQISEASREEDVALQKSNDEHA